MSSEIREQIIYKGVEFYWRTHGGEMECRACGSHWSICDQHPKWPIRIKWSKRWSFSIFPIKKHGYQLGWSHPSARVFATVIHLGFLRLIFGHSNKGLIKLVPTDFAKEMALLEAENIMAGHND